MIKTPKNAKLHTCEYCNFNCSKLCDYNRHILTAKHKFLTNPNENTPKYAKAFSCSCGKTYKHSSTLSAHKKKCTYIDNMNEDTTYDDEPEEIKNTISEQLTDASIVLRLLKQNDEFKELMVEQHKENVALQQQNMKLHSQMLDVVKDGTVINNNITNNTTNNQFNLNFFLNDTCKDAMNITDFLGTLNVKIDEIEYIGNHGYVNGMTKMIMARLKDMDITKRPIHCTDIKRETMYIKDQNEWCKDTDELTKLRKILTRITMNNYRTVPQWKTAHPKCEEMDTRDYNFCYKMMRVILGDVEEAQIRLDNKIIKSLSKELYVEKKR